MDKIIKLREMIEESNRIVFFGGAGVSTESNIPDFRSADGLYQEAFHFPPEQVVSHTFFIKKTEMFYLLANICWMPSHLIRLIQRIVRLMIG